MKVFLSPSNQDDNSYAYGNTNEYAVCGDIADLCKEMLEANGIEVMLMHDENMATKVAKSNAWGADLYVPIHTNAFNGEVSGTRMFYYSETGRKACQAIFNYLAPLTPGTSENIRQVTNLYEVAYPNAYTAFIEIDFHDVYSVAKWIIEHKKEIADAIAHGICDYAGVSYNKAPKAEPESTTPVQSNVLYKVQVGAYSVKSNADNMLKKLKAAGYEGFIVEVKK